MRFSLKKKSVDNHLRINFSAKRNFFRRIRRSAPLLEKLVFDRSDAFHPHYPLHASAFPECFQLNFSPPFSGRYFSGLPKIRFGRYRAVYMGGFDVEGANNLPISVLLAHRAQYKRL